MSTQKHTLGLTFKHYKKRFSALTSPSEADALCRWLFAELVGVAYDQVKLHEDTLLNEAQLSLLSDWALELETHKPVQYVLGKAWFLGLELRITDAVLIPRIETEAFVQELMQAYTPLGATRRSVLDMGTGSGCIALGLKKYFSSWQVSALDISVEAIKVARNNARMLGIDVDFYEANILTTDLLLDIFPHQYDILLSNPPYIPLTQKKDLERRVSAYEPSLALFVPDENPLLFVRAIAAFAVERLSAQGVLYIEIDPPSAALVEHFFIHETPFAYVRMREDIYGLKRFIEVRDAQK